MERNSNVLTQQSDVSNKMSAKKEKLLQKVNPKLLEITPKLSGVKGSFIDLDLEENSLQVGTRKLMMRFFKNHDISEKCNKNQIQNDVIVSHAKYNKNNEICGVVTENLSFSFQKDNDVEEEDKPGRKLQKLKMELQDKMSSKWEEEYKKRLNESKNNKSVNKHKKNFEEEVSQSDEESSEDTENFQQTTESDKDEVCNNSEQDDDSQVNEDIEKDCNLITDDNSNTKESVCSLEEKKNNKSPQTADEFDGSSLLPPYQPGGGLLYGGSELTQGEDSLPQNILSPSLRLSLSESPSSKSYVEPTQKNKELNQFDETDSFLSTKNKLFQSSQKINDSLDSNDVFDLCSGKFPDENYKSQLVGQSSIEQDLASCSETDLVVKSSTEKKVRKDFEDEEKDKGNGDESEEEEEEGEEEEEEEDNDGDDEGEVEDDDGENDDEEIDNEVDNSDDDDEEEEEEEEKEITEKNKQKKRKNIIAPEDSESEDNSSLHENEGSDSPKKKIISDDEDESQSTLNFPKKKTRKNLCFSDDEEDGAIDQKSDSSDESENNEEEKDEDKEEEEEKEEIDFASVNYDSEENEITNPREFFEKEAELSGSEWSGDEDERGLDDFEKEDGDAEHLDNDEVRSQLEKIHIRRILDDDAREVRMIQEILFEDGDLHSDGKGRDRKFKWKNLGMFEDKGGNTEETKEDAGNSSEEEYAEDEKLLKLRHQKEMFLMEMKKSGTVNLNDDIIEEEFQIHNVCSLKQIVKVSVTEETKVESFNASFKEIKRFNNTRGSFLTRNEEFLSRIAKVASGVTDSVMGPKNSKNFVFVTKSPKKCDIDKSTTHKRQSENSENFGKKDKKIKLSHGEVNVGLSILDMLV